MGCIFCDIVNKNIACDKIYENEYVLAFKDAQPQAPVHFLVVPKKHYNDVESVAEDEMKIFADIFAAINRIAKKLNLKNGFRVVNNCKEQAGQTVNHIHFHVLSERDMAWPPG